MRAADLTRALRAFTKRQPFRPFFIEFNSGDRLQVTHPEAIDRQEDLFVFRGPDGGHRIFSPTGVCQLIDPPPPAQGS